MKLALFCRLEGLAEKITFCFHSCFSSIRLLYFEAVLTRSNSSQGISSASCPRLLDGESGSLPGRLMQRMAASKAPCLRFPTCKMGTANPNPRGEAALGESRPVQGADCCKTSPPEPWQAAENKTEKGESIQHRLLLWQHRCSHLPETMPGLN